MSFNKLNNKPKLNLHKILKNIIKYTFIFMNMDNFKIYFYRNLYMIIILRIIN